jgi:myo-inositol 2-dehydrogenase / D-chiro-inositol 1-dehydrogenase
MKKIKKSTRRKFLKTTGRGIAGAFAIPFIVPSTVFGAKAPSNRINIGAIGVGRISLVHDMPSVLKYDQAQIVAVSDVDLKRIDNGKKFVNDFYSKKTGKAYEGVTGYQNYQELLENKDIDAVIVSTPDHWHAKQAIDAVYAGKDVSLQKPASLTIEEGRKMSDAVNRTGRIFQIGSQQRSANPWPQFKLACELVRNGRIGEIHSIEVGLPGDPAGGNPEPMPVPDNLDYDMWLGQTPYVFYTEDRVHSQTDITSRPGWLRCEQFGAGMITGWGAHHIDIGHWGMGTEYSGPIEISGWAEFPSEGLWTVHGKFRTEALYDNGVNMIVSNELPNGIKFIGSDGWIWVTRGSYSVTASDPGTSEDNKDIKSFDASDARILKTVIGPDEIKLYHSEDHHGNWLDCIRTRKQPIAPAEVAHRSCSACLLHHAAMKVDRKLYWDPLRERFKNDDEANKFLSRGHRPPYEF